MSQLVRFRFGWRSWRGAFPTRLGPIGCVVIVRKPALNLYVSHADAIVAAAYSARVRSGLAP
jgi:hypothetical protein